MDQKHAKMIVKIKIHLQDIEKLKASIELDEAIIKAQAISRSEHELDPRKFLRLRNFTINRCKELLTIPELEQYQIDAMIALGIPKTSIQ